MPLDPGRQLTFDLYLLIGLYGLAVGAGGVLAADRFTRLVDGFAKEPVHAYLAGLIAFVWGGAQSLAHWRWDGLLPGIITAMGLFILIEGLLLMAAPSSILGRFLRLVRPIAGRAYGLFAIVFGIVFIAIGLIGRLAA